MPSQCWLTRMWQSVISTSTCDPRSRWLCHLVLVRGPWQKCAQVLVIMEEDMCQTRGCLFVHPLSDQDGILRVTCGEYTPGGATHWRPRSSSSGWYGPGCHWLAARLTGGSIITDIGNLSNQKKYYMNRKINNKKKCGKFSFLGSRHPSIRAVSKHPPAFRPYTLIMIGDTFWITASLQICSREILIFLHPSTLKWYFTASSYNLM